MPRWALDLLEQHPAAASGVVDDWSPSFVPPHPDPVQAAPPPAQAAAADGPYHQGLLAASGSDPSVTQQQASQCRWRRSGSSQRLRAEHHPGTSMEDPVPQAALPRQPVEAGTPPGTQRPPALGATTDDRGHGHIPVKAPPTALPQHAGDWQPRLASPQLKAPPTTALAGLHRGTPARALTSCSGPTRGAARHLASTGAVPIPWQVSIASPHDVYHRVGAAPRVARQCPLLGGHHVRRCPVGTTQDGANRHPYSGMVPVPAGGQSPRVVHPDSCPAWATGPGHLAAPGTSARHAPSRDCGQGQPRQP